MRGQRGRKAHHARPAELLQRDELKAGYPAASQDRNWWAKAEGSSLTAVGLCVHGQQHLAHIGQVCSQYADTQED